MSLHIPSSSDRVLLIAPPTMVVDHRMFLGSHRMYLERFFVQRLHAWLKDRCRSTEFVDCQTDPAAILSLRGQRTAGPKSVAPVKVNCGYHGLGRHEVITRLRSMEPPDQVWITTLFTYDREPVRETISAVKSVFPEVPVVVGGVYATLCPDDAKAIGADEVHEGLLLDVESRTCVRNGWMGLVIMGRGCPNACSFCATRFNENVTPYVRPTADVARDVDVLIRDGVRCVFLYATNMFSGHSAEATEEILEALTVKDASVLLYTGLEPSVVTSRRAELLRQAGVLEVNVPIQTLDRSMTKRWGRRDKVVDYVEAIGKLRSAGFVNEQLCSDVLIGHPEQTLEEAVRTLCYVWSQGVTPLLLPYTLVPRSADERRFGSLVNDLSLEERHFLLWATADTSQPVSEFLQLSLLSRVMPSLVEKAIQYLDPGSAVAGLIDKYLDEFGLCAPQLDVKVPLPAPSRGAHGYMSHPWELALELVRQGNAAAIEPFIGRCEANPVCEPAYFEIPLGLLKAGMPEQAASLLRRASRWLPLDIRETVLTEMACDPPAIPSAFGRVAGVISEVHASCGLLEESASWRTFVRG